MKRTILSCIVAVALFATFAWAADPVCIVGAGPAGLTVANRLEAKGYKTVIFEKEPDVGGKCQDYYDSKGNFHPMGALLYTNGTYLETLPVIDVSGVPPIPFNISDQKPWNYDPSSGFVLPWIFSLSEMAKTSEFQAEIKNYTTFWNEEFKRSAVVGYKNGVKGYTMSTFEWLRVKKYPLLLFAFVQGMVPFGYGDITKVPVIYMLQYFTPDILSTFTQPGKTAYIIDFHQVFKNYTHNHIIGPIHKNTMVTKIDRSGDFPVVSYNGPTQYGLLTQNCSKLVLAFPPVMHALNAANLDLDRNERAVFSSVGITKYWSGAVKVTIPFGNKFLGCFTGRLLEVFLRVLRNYNKTDMNQAFRDYSTALPEAAGYPMGFVPVLNIATTWSWGSNQTLGEAKSLLKKLLSKLNKDPKVPTEEPKPITDADVVAFREWDYFPHFDQDALENGIYEKFEGLQGYKNTYYASGLNGFETVEFAIRAGMDVADRFAVKDVVDHAFTIQGDPQ